MQEALPGLGAGGLGAGGLGTDGPGAEHVGEGRPGRPSAAPAVEPGRLLVVPHGAPAREAVATLVEALRSDDPLTPVTVAVPSPLAGLALRRALGARSGFVNVRFTALARVAELLGAPTLAAQDRRPLSPALRLEAIHRALELDEGGVLANVRNHPATAGALAATFDDLADVDDEARAQLATRSERAATVVRLYERYRELTADCYDVADVARAAARAVRDGAPTADEAGHVVLHLPLGITTAELELLAALAERQRLTALIGHTGDAHVDEELGGALVRQLAPLLGEPVFVHDSTAAPPVAQRLLCAPDPDDEVRAVARELDARARAGASLGRVALLYRVPEPYERLVPEVLTTAGIPWTGAAPRRLADSAAGRLLLGLLALPEHDLARDDVAAWLASAPVIDPTDRSRVNATRWDVLSREAGVVAGAAQWIDRLTRRREEVERELGEPADGELDTWQRRHRERTRDDLAALTAFVTGLAEALAPPDPPSWRALARWAEDLFTRYAGTEAQRADWPDTELAAARAIAVVLDELAALDSVLPSSDAPPDVDRFRRTLEAELDARMERVGRFGSGVLVGQVGQAYAGDLDVVYVLGAVEGSLPPRGREDPLLPDHERRGIDALPQHATLRLQERRDYLAALAAAPERVLTFPRADPRAQRKRLPARWVVESARVHAGHDLTAEALREHERAPWFESIESFESLVQRGDAVSATEYRLAALRRWRDAGRALDEHPLAAGALARGFAAADARAAWRATPFDGFIGPSPDLAPGVARPTSPTALQAWAGCPFRYFLARVLRLHDIPRPEETISISPLDEGALIHAVLEEFLRGARPLSSPDEPWTAEDHQRMREIVERHCDEAERRGITGRPVMWTLARRRITTRALEFLTVDERVRAELGVVPTPDGLERAFGDDGEPPVEVTLRDGQVVRFRGRIDRVDRSPDGRRTVVYDYKTGRRNDTYEQIAEDPVVGGHLLQLPVYALAARAADGTDEAIAAYWFTAEPDAPLVEVALEDAEARFVDVVSTIVEGMRAGCFPAYPGERRWDHRAMREAWEMCWSCEFDRLCSVDRGVAWERVATDAASAPFRALWPDEDEA